MTGKNKKILNIILVLNNKKKSAKDYFTPKYLLIDLI